MDILFEWFSQPLSFGVIVIDLIFLALGMIWGKRATTTRKKTILISICFLVCIFAIIITQIRNWALQLIVGVFGSGIAILILIGALIGIGLSHLKNKNTP